jgi:lipopolysaccharide biosynthesis protein
LCNDSCYGPLGDFGAFLSGLDPARADVWGMTDSLEVHWHLQSYFLLFHTKALRHPAFRAFWRGFRYVRSKHLIIQDYELGLSSRLRAGGLRLAAAFPYEGLARTARESNFQYCEELARAPLNPTLFMWDILARDRGAPLVKTELFKQNRFRSLAIEQWKSLLGASGYDLTLIERHRPTVVKNRRTSRDS